MNKENSDKLNCVLEEKREWKTPVYSKRTISQKTEGGDLSHVSKDSGVGPAYYKNGS